MREGREIGDRIEMSLGEKGGREMVDILYPLPLYRPLQPLCMEYCQLESRAPSINSTYTLVRITITVIMI